MTTAIERAISEAVEKGAYDAKIIDHDGIGRPLVRRMNGTHLSHSSMFLDPAFWQALARSRGEIDANWPNGEMRCENKLGRCDQRYCEYGGYKNPYDRWHSFIDFLASNGTPEEFFATIV